MYSVQSSRQIQNKSSDGRLLRVSVPCFRVVAHVDYSNMQCIYQYEYDEKRRDLSLHVVVWRSFGNSFIVFPCIDYTRFVTRSGRGETHIFYVKLYRFRRSSRIDRMTTYINGKLFLRKNESNGIRFVRVPPR